MLDYAIGIVAHTARAEQANQLAYQVGAKFFSVDDGTLGGDRNHLAVWAQLAERDTEWSVVLEDDAQPINDFDNQLDQALSNSPTPIISLYLGKTLPICRLVEQRLMMVQECIPRAVEKAQANNASFITAPVLLHCVGVAIRTELVPSLLAMPPQALPIDEHITRWAQWQHHSIAYTWPSLVDHADGESVIRQHQRNDGMPRPPGRKAWAVGSRDAWDSTTVSLEMPR